MSLVVYGACAGDIEFFINGTSIASGTATAGLSCSCQSIAGDPDIPQNYTVTVTPAIQAAYVLGGSNTLSAAANNSPAGVQCFYGADVIVNEVLPVELISFEGRYINEDISLSWLTATELNNEKFQIELSHDGKEFQMVGEVEGKGTTDIKNEYIFSIEDPRSGLNYIRLKQLDFDGQFEYSNIISLNVKRGGEQVGELYPNPNKSGLVNLDYTSKRSEHINVLVYDITGKIILHQAHSIIKGENKLNFDFSVLNKGIYIVEIGNESFRTHRKLILK